MSVFSEGLVEPLSKRLSKRLSDCPFERFFAESFFESLREPPFGTPLQVSLFSAPRFLRKATLSILFKAENYLIKRTIGRLGDDKPGR